MKEYTGLQQSIPWHLSYIFNNNWHLTHGLICMHHGFWAWIGGRTMGGAHASENRKMRLISSKSYPSFVPLAALLQNYPEEE